MLKGSRVGEDEAPAVNGGEKTKTSCSGGRERTENGGGGTEKGRDRMGIPETRMKGKTETNGEKIGTGGDVTQKTEAGGERREKTGSGGGKTAGTGSDEKTGGTGEKTGGSGQLLPDAVPATSLKFRPGDPTSYLVGTVAGHLLVVSAS